MSGPGTPPSTTSRWRHYDECTLDSPTWSVCTLYSLSVSSLWRVYSVLPQVVSPYSLSVTSLWGVDPELPHVVSLYSLSVTSLWGVHSGLPHVVSLYSLSVTSLWWGTLDSPTWSVCTASQWGHYDECTLDSPTWSVCTASQWRHYDECTLDSPTWSVCVMVWSSWFRKVSTVSSLAGKQLHS